MGQVAIKVESKLGIAVEILLIIPILFTAFSICSSLDNK